MPEPTKSVVLPGHDVRLDDADIRQRFSRLQHSRATTTVEYDQLMRRRGSDLTGAEPPPKPILYGATDLELLDRAEAEIARHRAWCATADGRFVEQLDKLATEYGASSVALALIETMRSARSRGWSPENLMAIHRALGDLRAYTNRRCDDVWSWATRAATSGDAA